MNKLKYIVTFLNINGFYLVLAIAAITLGLSKSSMFSIPVKAITSILMLYGILIHVKRLKITNPFILSYLLFIFLYTVKLIIEVLYPNPNLLHPVSKIAIYMVAHSISPFFFYLLIEKTNYKLIFNALFYSGLIFNISVYFIYGDFLREGVGRIGNWQSRNLTDDATLSPLVLAYSSTITIVLAIYSLLNNQNKLKNKLLYIFAIIAATPSFLLGASRGALLGIIISFSIYFLFSRKVSTTKITIFTSVIVLFLINLAIVYQSTVIKRFISLFETDTTQNLRYTIYKSTFYQFVESPLIGGSIQNDTVNHFPHNIFLESMTATGIFGFLALSYLTISALKRTLFIFKNDTSNAWIGIIFIIYFIHSLFNAAIYLAIGFWMFIGLLLGYKKNVNSN